MTEGRRTGQSSTASSRTVEATIGREATPIERAASRRVIAPGRMPPPSRIPSARELSPSPWVLGKASFARLRGQGWEREDRTGPPAAKRNHSRSIYHVLCQHTALAV